MIDKNNSRTLFNSYTNNGIRRGLLVALGMTVVNASVAVIPTYAATTDAAIDAAEAGPTADEIASFQALLADAQTQLRTARWCRSGNPRCA